MNKKERDTVREIKKSKPVEAPISPFHAEITAMEEGNAVTETTRQVRQTLKMFIPFQRSPQTPVTFAVPKSDPPPPEPAQSIIVDIPADEVMKLVESCFKDLEKYKRVKKGWEEGKNNLETKRNRMIEIKGKASEIADAMFKLGVSVDKDKFETVKTEQLIEMMTKAASKKITGLKGIFNADKKPAIENKVSELENLRAELAGMNQDIPFMEKSVSDYKKLHEQIRREIDANMASIEAVLMGKNESETLPPQGPNANTERLEGVKIMPFVRVKSAFDVLKKALGDL